MGLFSRNYSKPGKGVSKNAPQKAAIFTLFEVYFRKFWNLILLNLIYFLCSAIPIIFIAGVQVPFILGHVSAANLPLELLPYLFIITCVFIVLGVGAFGPAQAGFIYVVRNYSEEKHAFVWKDFFDCAKANFKQGLLVSIIDFIISFLLCFNIFSIRAMDVGTYTNIVSAVNYAVFAIFLMMHMYLYQIMITFKLSIWQIYKMSFLMVVSNISSALMTFMFIILLVSTPFFSVQLGFLLILFLLFSTVGFIYTFYANRRIKRTLIDNVFRFKSCEGMKDKIRGDI